MALAYLVSDVGGRDVDGGNINERDVGMRRMGTIVVAGAWVDIYLIVVDNVLPIAPTLDGGKIVGAHDEAELFVTVLLAEVGEGKYSVGRYRQVELHIASTHVIVVVYGTTYHLKPLLVGKESVTLLERVLRRDHIPHLVKTAVRQHGIANDEMPHMDGVERAEKKADVSHRSKNYEL